MGSGVDDTQPASLGSGPTLAAGEGLAVSGEVELGRGSIVGRYVILAGLGAGGMGVVHAAYDPELDRKVALKLLKPKKDASADSQKRLLREAQALAKLQHPNVVAVHDAGTWHGRVWVAMEFVRGETLAGWLRARERGWREVLAVMIDVARGLSAAHELGLVHRDVKPDNIMISTDGRVRVMDFGLVRAEVEGEGRNLTTSQDSRALPARQALVEELTQDGAVMGTPAYMAPEQFVAASTDPRTDQFSWCVTTWEALFGERPFAGATLWELSLSIAQGRLRRTRRGRGVPGWLRRVLERGMSNAPRDRFASMQDLLAAVERGSRRRTRVLAALGVTSLVGAAVAGFVVSQERAAVCGGAEARARAIWDEARRAQLEQGFKATGLGFAEETARLVSARFDQYAQLWAEGVEDACRMHQRGEQSDHVFDLRTLCLERRYAEFSALVRLMATPDGAALDHAVQAAQGLKPVDACGDVPELLERERWLQLPDDPEAVAQVQALSRELAEVSASEQAGRVEQGLARSTVLMARAQAVGHGPTLAEALYVHGRLLEQAGRTDEALSALWSSMLAAEQAGHDMARAEAMVHYLFVAATWGEESSDFENIAAMAEALVARVAPESRLQGQLFNNLAIRHDMRQRSADAESMYRRSLALLERVLGQGHPEVAFLRVNLGSYLLDRGHFSEAEKFLRDALSQIVSALGESHPNVYISRLQLADALLGQGRYEEAISEAGPGFRGYEALVGPDNPRVAWFLAMRGEIQFRRGALPLALADLERAARLVNEELPAPMRIRARFVLAQALWSAGAERERAILEARRAASEAERTSDVRLPAIKAWLAERSMQGRGGGEVRTRP